MKRRSRGQGRTAGVRSLSRPPLERAGTGRMRRFQTFLPLPTTEEIRPKAVVRRARDISRPRPLRPGTAHVISLREIALARDGAPSRSVRYKTRWGPSSGEARLTSGVELWRI